MQPADSSLTKPAYANGAYRGDAIPEQPAPKETNGFVKVVEAGDFLERLPWGSYANLDVNVSPNTARIFQERMNGRGRVHTAGPTWTHRHNPTEFIKTRWELLLMLAGAFADYGMLKFWGGVLLFSASLSAMVHGWGEFIGFSQIGLVILGLHFFFRYPFTWLLERYPQILVKDLGCGFFRTTGMLKFRTWREETFEAPFIEFDPYISFSVNPKGPVTYSLVLRHRYTGRTTTAARVAQLNKVELYAYWDELQRYMDVSQPLPDVPALEKYRPLDPTTAEYDAAGKRGRPADYWATLDLEWWEQEGYPAHLEKIKNFPWTTLEDQMEKSVKNFETGSMV